MSNLTREQIEHLGRFVGEYLAHSLNEPACSNSERYRGAFIGQTAGRLDEALTEMAQAMDNAAVKRHIDKIRDIAAAHKRIAAENYGLCLDSSAIGNERLLAYPSIKHCIQSRLEHEKRNALHKGRAVLR